MHSRAAAKMGRPRLCKYFIVLFLTLVWLHPIVTSSDDKDDNGHRDNNTPIMGLQVWDTASSFNQALE
eukprot:scaffold20640_cov50-Skeletonema_dohrnii-CCMP3373.AAC.1